MARPPAAVISAATESAGRSATCSPFVGSPFVGSPFVGSPFVGSPCSPEPGSLTTTAAPCAAMRRACARPSPRPPPVTIATLPSSRPIRQLLSSAGAQYEFVSVDVESAGGEEGYQG